MPSYPLAWPASFMSPEKIKVDLLQVTMSGGASLAGKEQVVGSMLKYWKISYSSVPVYEPARVQVWRAIAAQLAGRLGTIDVPIYDGLNGPGAPTAYVPWTGTRITYFDDGTTWDDGTGFLDVAPPPPAAIDLFGAYTGFADGATFADGALFRSPRVSASVAAAAAVTATQVQIAFAGGASGVTAGQHFSIAGRLYRIQSVDAVAGSVATLSIAPWLRTAIAVGDVAEFDNPTCRCNLATDGEMDIEFSPPFIGFGSINFTEAFPT